MTTEPNIPAELRAARDAMNVQQAQVVLRGLLDETVHARDLIEKIKKLAIGGHERAIMSLVEIGIHASEALQDVWFEKHPSLFGYSEHDAVTLRRLKLMALFRGGFEIPTIARSDEVFVTWDASAEKVRLQVLTREPRRKLKRQKEMLAALKPKLRYLGREGFARFIYDRDIYPLWFAAHLGFRPMPTQFAGLDRLRSDNLSAWATAVRDWIWSKHATEIRTRGTTWRFLAVGSDKSKTAPKKKTLRSGKVRQFSDGELKDSIYQLFYKILGRM